MEKKIKNNEEKIKKKLKNKQGITLIALVVTIVVLLILASISIGALTSDNGIIDEAHTAKEDTEIASWEEQIDLAIIDAESKHRNPDYNDIIQELINKKIINDESQVDENGTITTNEPMYEIAGKIDEYLPIPAGLEIGSDVLYNPKGEYSFDKKYSSYTGGETITLSTSDKDYNISNWKVLEIDREKEKVTLIPSLPTIGELSLAGFQGYNNAVYLLNEICNNLYGYAGLKNGITARSINIGDIEKYILPSKLEEAKTSSNYNTRKDEAYESVRFPFIYEEEIKSVIDDNPEKESGLGQSEQKELEGPSTGVFSGSSRAETIWPYQTKYSILNLSEKTFNAIEKNSKLNNYYKLIVPNKEYSYWIATRAINLYDEYCSFDIYKIYNSCLLSGSLCTSNSSASSNKSGIFPIVEVDSKMIEKNNNGDYEIDVE